MASTTTATESRSSPTYIVKLYFGELEEILVKYWQTWEVPVEGPEVAATSSSATNVEDRAKGNGAQDAKAKDNDLTEHPADTTLTLAQQQQQRELQYQRWHLTTQAWKKWQDIRSLAEGIWPNGQLQKLDFNDLLQTSAYEWQLANQGSFKFHRDEPELKCDLQVGQRRGAISTRPRGE